MITGQSLWLQHTKLSSQQKETRHWSRQKKSEETVMCPLAVATYNKYMDGDELVDGLLRLYRIPIKSKK